MKLKYFILPVVLLLVGAGCAVRQQASAPELSNKEVAYSLPGVSFVVPQGAMTAGAGTSSNGGSYVTLWDVETYESIKKQNLEAFDGPPSIDIYSDVLPKGMSAEQWLKGNSGYFSAGMKVESVVVGNMQAVKTNDEGLFSLDIVAIPTPDKSRIIVIAYDIQTMNSYAQQVMNSMQFDGQTTSISSVEAKLPVIAYEADGRMTEADKKRIKTKFVDPFVACWKAAHLVSVVITPSEKIGGAYSITTVFLDNNNTAGGFTFGARGEDFEAYTCDKNSLDWNARYLPGSIKGY